MTYEEYKRDLATKRQEKLVNAECSSEKANSGFMRTLFATENVKTAKKPVKTAKWDPKSGDFGEFKTFDEHFEAKRATVSTHNPNKAFRHSKIRKEIEKLNEDEEIDQSDEMVWLP